mmetsp:Transcript_9181/g.16168  ORF Transcript_9181/g.16168 Transcript_9181/m.16168 type:complete len:226 (-) Transcript_9181:75-752(-)
MMKALYGDVAHQQRTIGHHELLIRGAGDCIGITALDAWFDLLVPARTPADSVSPCADRHAEVELLFKQERQPQVRVHCVVSGKVAWISTEGHVGINSSENCQCWMVLPSSVFSSIWIPNLPLALWNLIWASIFFSHSVCPAYLARNLRLPIGTNDPSSDEDVEEDNTNSGLVLKPSSAIKDIISEGVCTIHLPSSSFVGSTCHPEFIATAIEAPWKQLNRISAIL